MAKKIVKKVDSEVVAADAADFQPDMQPVIVVDAEKKFNMSSDEHRTRILSLWKNIKDNYLEIGMLLAHAQTERRYESWGYSTFKEYAQRELGVKYTKAKYLADTWRHLSRNEVVLTKVSDVGWDKMKTLTRVVTEDNVDSWVEKAKHLSADDLKKEVKTYMMSMVPDEAKEALANESAVEGTPVKEQMKSITFQFSYEDYLTVSTAIDKIKTANPEIQSNSVCVALACAEYVATNSFDAEGDQFFFGMLRKYELALGVRVSVWRPSTNEIPYGAEAIRDMVKGATNGE